MESQPHPFDSLGKVLIEVRADQRSQGVSLKGSVNSACQSGLVCQAPPGGSYQVLRTALANRANRAAYTPLSDGVDDFGSTTNQPLSGCSVGNAGAADATPAPSPSTGSSAHSSSTHSASAIALTAGSVSMPSSSLSSTINRAASASSSETTRCLVISPPRPEHSCEPWTPSHPRPRPPAPSRQRPVARATLAAVLRPVLVARYSVCLTISVPVAAMPLRRWNLSSEHASVRAARTFTPFLPVSNEPPDRSLSSARLLLPAMRYDEWRPH